MSEYLKTNRKPPTWHPINPDTGRSYCAGISETRGVGKTDNGVTIHNCVPAGAAICTNCIRQKGYLDDGLTAKKRGEITSSLQAIDRITRPG